LRNKLRLTLSEPSFRRESWDAESHQQDGKT